MLEGYTIYGVFKHERCDDAIGAQGRKNGQRLPVAIRHKGFQPLTFHASAAKRRYVGLGSGLGNEDTTRSINIVLVFLPPTLRRATPRIRGTSKIYSCTSDLKQPNRYHRQ